MLLYFSFLPTPLRHSWLSTPRLRLNVLRKQIKDGGDGLSQERQIILFEFQKKSFSKANDRDTDFERERFVVVF